MEERILVAQVVRLEFLCLGGGSISTDVEGEGGAVAMFVVCVASSMCKVCNGVSVAVGKQVKSNKIQYCISVQFHPQTPIHNFCLSIHISLLPSGRRFRSIRSRTSRLRDSFFPQANEQSEITHLHHTPTTCYALHFNTVQLDYTHTHTLH